MHQAADTADYILTTEGLTKEFTGFVAVRNVDLRIRRGAILLILLLGYLYFRTAGEAYALVQTGLISFAAVAQFAPSLLGGIFWKGASRAGALGGLCAGFAVWTYTLLLPAFARSGWIPERLLTDGPFGIG